MEDVGGSADSFSEDRDDRIIRQGKEIPRLRHAAEGCGRQSRRQVPLRSLVDAERGDAGEGLGAGNIIPFKGDTRSSSAPLDKLLLPPSAEITRFTADYFYAREIKNEGAPD